MRPFVLVLSFFGVLIGSALCFPETSSYSLKRAGALSSYHIFDNRLEKNIG